MTVYLYVAIDFASVHCWQFRSSSCTTARWGRYCCILDVVVNLCFVKLGQKSVSDPTSHSHGQTSNPCIPVHIVCDSSEQVNCIGERSCAYGPSITHYHSQHEYIILDHQLDVTQLLRTITHMRHEIDWRVWFRGNTCVKKHEFQLSNCPGRHIWCRVRIQKFEGWQKRCHDPGSNQRPSDLQSDALPTELSRLSYSTTLSPESYIIPSECFRYR